MTALSGPFIVHATEGSDSAASGVGDPTSITVSMMIATSSKTTSSAMWSGTINAGDVVYFNASTGRKFNVVASADNTIGFQSITFDEYWGENISGNAYCGGKRATLGGLASAFDKDDGIDCEVSLETDVTMNASAVAGSTQVTIKSNSSTAQRKITTNQSYPFQGGIWKFQYITFHSVAAGSTQRLFKSESSGTIGKVQVTAYHCIFGDVDNVNNLDCLINGVSSSLIISNYPIFRAHDCVFVNMTDEVFGITDVQLHGCHFKNCPYLHQPRLSGLIQAAYGLKGVVAACFFENCDRIDRSTVGSNVSWFGNIFDSLAGTVIFGTVNPAFYYDASTPSYDFYKNLITNSTNVGDGVIGRDTFLYNTSGEISGLENTTTLSADPYVDRSGGDWDFTSDAYTSFDIGPSRIEVLGFNSNPTGGGGGIRKVTMCGGMDG